MTEIDLTEAQRILDGLQEDMNDPEAEHYVQRMQDNYEMAVRAEYGMEKDGGEYEF